MYRFFCHVDFRFCLGQYRADLPTHLPTCRSTDKPTDRGHEQPRRLTRAVGRVFIHYVADAVKSIFPVPSRDEGTLVRAFFRQLRIRREPYNTSSEEKRVLRNRAYEEEREIGIVES